MKSRKELSSFINYCLDHPELRFWQALRNWSSYKFIYGSYLDKDISNVFSDAYLDDTFHKEGK